MATENEAPAEQVKDAEKSIKQFVDDHFQVIHVK
jgi:hypothetical protein